MASSSNFELETISSSSRPLRISIPSSRLNSPVAPPSTFFAGMNEDINTEPFPAFDHSARPDGAPSSVPLHCAFHCDKKICRRQRRLNQVLPLCTCLSDSFSSSSIEPPSPQPTRPSLTFLPLDGNRSYQQALLRRRSPDTEIEIHLTEVQEHLQHLKIETIARVLRTISFMEAMREAFADHDIRMAVITVEQFFDTMSLYFDRTVPLTRPRAVVLEQLWTELDVYLWTMLRDWVVRHCDGEEGDPLLRFNGPECVRLADSGAPAVVLSLWRESTKVLVETLVWRDDEVKNCHDRTWMWVILGSMFFIFIVWP